MKDVTMIGVNELHLAWTTQQQPWCKPTVEKARQSPNSSSLRSMSMYKVWALAQEQAIELPNRCEVLERDFPAHFRDEVRNHVGLFCEVAHIAFAFGNGSRNQQRLILTQSRGQPDYMFRRSTNVEPRDNTHNLCHRSFRISNSVTLDLAKTSASLAALVSESRTPNSKSSMLNHSSQTGSRYHPRV